MSLLAPALKRSQGLWCVRFSDSARRIVATYPAQIVDCCLPSSYDISLVKYILESIICVCAALQASRVTRIARGSGHAVGEVLALLEEHKRLAKMFQGAHSAVLHHLIVIEACKSRWPLLEEHKRLAKMCQGLYLCVRAEPELCWLRHGA